MDNRNSKLHFALVIALALAVRFYGLQADCLNMDEVAELHGTQLSLAELVVAKDSMPPLYPILLKGWQALWGSDSAARLFSALCGVGAVVCVWGIARELFDEAAGSAAALLAAVLPLHVYYAQQIRTYSLYTLLAGLAIWLFVRARRRDRTADWLAFAVAAAVGLYAHYYFAILVLVIGMVIVAERGRGAFAPRLLLAFALVALLAIPVFLLLPSDLATQAGESPPRPLHPLAIPFTYLSLFTGYSLGPSKTDLHVAPLAQAAREMVPWAVVIGIATGVLVWQGWCAARRNGSAWLLAALAILPVVLIALMSELAGVNYHVRHVVWVLVPVCVAMGAGIGEASASWRVRLSVAALMVISAVAIYNRHHVPRYMNDDFRSLGDYLEQHVADHEPVFLLSDYLKRTAEYYTRLEQGVVTLPIENDANEVIDEPADLEAALATMQGALAQQDRFWLIYSRAFHGDPQGLLRDELVRSWRIEPVAEFNGIRLFRGDWRPAE